VLSLPPSCRIFLATAPCDMRKGFAGLLAEVRARWSGEDPFAGHLFIFVSRRRNYVKILWWSAGGLSLFAKRLEKGVFRMPKVRPGQHSVSLDAADLAMLLEGIDWTRARRQRLLQPPRSLTSRGSTSGSESDLQHGRERSTDRAPV